MFRNEDLRNLGLCFGLEVLNRFMATVNEVYSVFGLNDNGPFHLILLLERRISFFCSKVRSCSPNHCCRVSSHFSEWCCFRHKCLFSLLFLNFFLFLHLHLFYFIFKGQSQFCLSLQDPFIIHSFSLFSKNNRMVNDSCFVVSNSWLFNSDHFALIVSGKAVIFLPPSVDI
jgi:hypothetical protein